MYASQQDLIDRFGEVELIELSDRADPPAGAIDANVVNLALSDADAEIDGYLARRYDLPLASTPARLVKVASDIARKNLYKDAPLDEVTDNYKAAVRWLENVSKGVVELDIAGNEPTGDTSSSPTFTAPDRVFTSDTLKDM